MCIVKSLELASGRITELEFQSCRILSKNAHEIQDLGAETWRNLSKLQQHRKAIPSHILICVFAAKRESEHISVGTSQAPNPNLGAGHSLASVHSTVPMTSVGIPLGHTCVQLSPDPNFCL